MHPWRMARVLSATPRWQRRPDQRPDALMASAFKLLLRDGYRRVTLEAIAADAGVSKATVYHYFTNKDDLLTQSVSARMAEKQREIERSAGMQSATAADRL